MRLYEFKSKLENIDRLAFKLPDNTLVPAHFHVTEVGRISKHFIDCGGVLRQEKVVSFQLWEADDFDHRLHPKKLLDIIKLSEQKLNIQNLDIEVEYQGNSIQKFGLDFDGKVFTLTTKQTNCLAKDKCGIPTTKNKIELSAIKKQTSTSCLPENGCC